MDTDQRAAEPGELCTCGRQAVLVFSTEEFGDVGYCGVEGSAFDPVLPCPWCGTTTPHREPWGDPARCPSYSVRPLGSDGAPVVRGAWEAGGTSRHCKGAAMSETTDDGPVRFTLPMKPSFRETATKEQAVGAPIRWRSDEDVMLQGVVVEWKDEEDGSVTLTVEASAPDS